MGLHLVRAKSRTETILSHCRFTYVCLAAALSIVPFLANNGNGRLSLDGYFVQRQSVIQHLYRWRALSVNLWMIQTLNSWSLRIAQAHSRVVEECACYNESRSSGCGPPAKETPQAEEPREECAAWLLSDHSFLCNSFARKSCLMRYAYALF